ncbi:hypothetical protein AN958_12361 [Leucoagaricus sp. SymC.cos]|nr:hypothetical protein AN958_12361 [Leucoagaricus sp. SymC.cos]
MYIGDNVPAVTVDSKLFSFNKTAMATSASPFPSPSHPLPSPTTKDKETNFHPYAIKTTSTGILTRSNSTKSTNSSIHRFVPSSPTTGKGDEKGVKRLSGRQHKYSRSLNADELPRPLPVPPNFTAAATGSPTSTSASLRKDVFDRDVDDPPFLVRRERRSDTLHSSTSYPNLFSTLLTTSGIGAGVEELPEDPRDWTTSELSMHLTSMLRVTEGDLPPLVAKDMVGFVRNQKINGRMFLRLTEGDLDKYGLNQRWQSALLSASRRLRQGSLRGRIWNSEGMFDDDDDQDAEREDESPSSTSSLSSSGSIKDRGKSHGRVKGMVASLERRGSSSSSSRSVSPVKNPFSASMSAVKSSKSYHHDPDSDRGRVRPRPQSDIFPSRSSYAIIDNSAEDSVDQKKEPRLLPLPLPPPAVAAANQVDYVPFNTSPSPIHVQTNPGPATFGPYGSPQLPSQEPSFAPFPSGVLPFSPQSTGTTIISQIQTPDPHPSSSLSTFIAEPQTQNFDALYVNALAAESGRSGGAVRPLPLPPHPGQFYQPLASSVPQGGIVMSTSSPGNSGSPVTGMYPLLPHGLGESSMDPTPAVPVPVPVPLTAASVPYVQVQRVPESQGLQSGGGTSSQDYRNGNLIVTLFLCSFTSLLPAT